MNFIFIISCQEAKLLNALNAAAREQILSDNIINTKFFQTKLKWSLGEAPEWLSSQNLPLNLCKKIEHVVLFRKKLITIKSSNVFF